ncbi:Pro-Pol [Willisornis vidua]|uniref:Pro-Pol n=1 Tax=Willisornis vidua TaxID=1566151 RepID=A0ABQ9CT42_9PASS|nr:Pro-Pol [Willisornis vidua]
MPFTNFDPEISNDSCKISIPSLAEKHDLVVDVSAVFSMDLGIISELCNACNDMSLPPPLSLSLCSGELPPETRHLMHFQGMRNRPSICQQVIADILSPVRKRHPNSVLHHYVDDILIAAETKDSLLQMHRDVKTVLFQDGLEIAPEKEQTTAPWKYLVFRTDNKEIRSHTSLPGPIAEGIADQIASTDIQAQTVTVPSNLEKAKLSHSFFHQNAKSLKKIFKLTFTQARAIIASCPDCQRVTPIPCKGVNPRGIHPLDLWQSDVTHYAPFGTLKHIHVSIDSCSGARVEKTRDAKRHFLTAISILGIPETIKTDNGPAYTSAAMTEFLNLWGISRLTGIPHSPTGQAIVEQAHQLHKNILIKQQGTTAGLSPQEKLNKALYVLNFLSRLEQDTSPIQKHFQGPNNIIDEKATVIYKDLITGDGVGPVPLITWRRGHACVSTGAGPSYVTGHKSEEQIRY